MTRPVRFAVAVLGWGAAAYGLLWFGGLPGDLGQDLFVHGLCGPWGCLPPLQALLALHALWVLILVPPVVWAVRRWPAGHNRIAGKLLVFFGVAGLAALIVVEALTWLPLVPPDDRRFLPQRVLYQLALLTDAPIVQVLTSGLALLIAARFRPRTQ